MYSPRFTYNNKIINYLNRIEFARGILTQSSIIPELDATLKNRAFMKSVHASTAIEGNTLTFEDVGKLYNGQKVIARKNEKQEVLNYIEVLKEIDKIPLKSKLKEKTVLNIHKEISTNVLRDKFYEGYYRDVEVRVENLQTGEVRYRPPSSLSVAELMKDLINWINNSNNVPNIIVAGVAHYEFVRIHPFIDGNGRTARALTSLILHIRGYDTKKYFTLDEYYDYNRKGYVDALKSADDSGDLTKWLEYFLEGFLVSILKVEDEIKRLSNKLGHSNDDVNLKESEMRIINFLQNEGKITNRETRELFGISSQASHNKLKKLEKNGIITRKGSGRCTYYVLSRIDERLRKRLMKNRKTVDDSFYLDTYKLDKSIKNY
jgi:Fic family protein